MYSIIKQTLMAQLCVLHIFSNQKCIALDNIFHIGGGGGGGNP